MAVLSMIVSGCFSVADPVPTPAQQADQAAAYFSRQLAELRRHEPEIPSDPHLQLEAELPVPIAPDPTPASPPTVADVSPHVEVQAPPELPPPRTDRFQEDFSNVAEGDLPDGWNGDPSIGVRRGRRGSWLQKASDAREPDRVYTPLIRMESDFEIEWQLYVNAARSGSVAITLHGTEGSRDLTVKVEAYNVWQVSFTEAAPTIIDVPKQRPSRTRLVRVGEMFHLIVNDKTLVVQRMPNHQRFERMSVAMAGNNPGQLFFVSVSPLDSGAPRDRTRSFFEDFNRVGEGNLPRGWTGVSSIGVRREEDIAWLEGTTDGSHEARTPELQIGTHFVLDWHMSLAWSRAITVTLEGIGTSPDLRVTLGHDFASRATAWLTDAASQPLDVPNDRTFRARLVREGEVYRLIVNDKTLVAQRMPAHQQFRRVVVSMTGSGNPPSQRNRLFDVRLTAGSSR